MPGIFLYEKASLVSMIDKEPQFRLIFIPGNGGVSEWSKELVLKTSAGQLAVGSNPTPSVAEGFELIGFPGRSG